MLHTADGTNFPLLEVAHRRRLQWFGRVRLHMTQGSRRRGRPNRIAQLTWIGITEYVREAEDRQEWRRIVKSSKCPSGQQGLQERLWLWLTLQVENAPRILWLGGRELFSQLLDVIGVNKIVETVTAPVGLKKVKACYLCCMVSSQLRRFALRFIHSHSGATDVFWLQCRFVYFRMEPRWQTRVVRSMFAGWILVHCAILGLVFLVLGRSRSLPQ